MPATTSSAAWCAACAGTLPTIPGPGGHAEETDNGHCKLYAQDIQEFLLKDFFGNRQEM